MRLWGWRCIRIGCGESDLLRRGRRESMRPAPQNLPGRKRRAPQNARDVNDAPQKAGPYIGMRGHPSFVRASTECGRYGDAVRRSFL